MDTSVMVLVILLVYVVPGFKGVRRNIREGEWGETMWGKS